MTDRHRDERPIPEPLEHSEATAGTNSSGILDAEHDETSDPFPMSIEEFIHDRFSMKLEDPHTGRRISWGAYDTHDSKQG
jgi:hypothetical protein